MGAGGRVCGEHKVQALEKATWKWKDNLLDEGLTKARLYCGKRESRRGAVPCVQPSDDETGR